MHVKSSLPKNFTHREQKYFNGVQGSKHKRRLRQRRKDMINGPQNPGHE